MTIGLDRDTYLMLPKICKKHGFSKWSVNTFVTPCCAAARLWHLCCNEWIQCIHWLLQCKWMWGLHWNRYAQKANGLNNCTMSESQLTTFHFKWKNFKSFRQKKPGNITKAILRQCFCMRFITSMFEWHAIMTLPAVLRRDFDTCVVMSEFNASADYCNVIESEVCFGTGVLPKKLMA